MWIDLAHNKRGEISPRQKEKLKSYRKTLGYGSIIALIAIIGSIAFLLGIVFLNADIETSALQQALPIILGVFGFVFVLFILFLLLGFYRARHLRSEKVSEVTGKAKLKTKKNQIRYGMGIFRDHRQTTLPACHQSGV